MNVSLEVWGDRACFTMPYGKVERISAPFPTPSAARGILSSICSKPAEFYWQVERIVVLNPIRYMSVKRNELNAITKYEPVFADEKRTQRQTVALQDVRYRITASICPRPKFKGTLSQLYEQALRRIRRGANFCQPCLGAREFAAHYEESDGVRQPIPQDLDAGLMVYDIFDLHDYEVRKKL